VATSVSTFDRAWWRISQEARDRVTDWLKSQGVDPSGVFRVDRISDTEIVVHTLDPSHVTDAASMDLGYDKRRVQVSSPPPAPLGSP
jgi:hypothetical protein